ncbi:MAG: murein transglycosylase domain-containing protein [Acidiferrobacterales bacterium]
MTTRNRFDTLHGFANERSKLIDDSSKRPLYSMRALLKLAIGLVTSALIASCSTHDAISVVTSGDPEAAAKAILRHKEAAYKQNPTLLVQDVKRARKQFRQLVAFFRKEVGKEWGADEVLVPSRKRYVKYMQNYKSRAVVDFDTGAIKVETLDLRDASLRSAIVTTLLTPNDPRSVDLYSDKPVKLTGKPYLYGLVVDHKNRPIGGPKRAEGYAEYLITNLRHERVIKTGDGTKLSRYVQFKMIPGHVSRQAARYERDVKHFSDKYRVSKSLVFAVIKTESNFNPFAVSHAPAYGLMQLVPASGGREAFRAVRGVDAIPTREYLFNARNNIELGTAYLGVIDQRYLVAIQNPVSREYCTIAAYNGGSRNVLRVFSDDRKRAVDIINGLSPATVYRKLRDHHPRQETRRYLVKVLDARKTFANI